jgi:hypothetical protein
MATGKGAIRGHTGVAAVGGAHQILVEARAHGAGTEQELLVPVVAAIQPLLSADSLISVGVVINGYVADHFRGARRDWGPCPLRDRCLRTPERPPTRQVAFFRGEAADAPARHTDRMKRRLDTPEGRLRYGRRFATVGPVFGNLRANTGLDRFTLRGRAKVDGQWKRSCLVYDIEKLARHGYAA